MAVWRYVTRTKTRLLDIDPNDASQGQAELPIGVDVVFHIDIPDANNPAGVSYRVACRDEMWNEEQNKVVPLVKDLQVKNSGWYDKLQTGAAYQKLDSFKFTVAYLNSAQRDSEIDAEMQRIKDTVLAQKQVEWMYWGNTDTLT